jgi:hypothetical protein
MSQQEEQLMKRTSHKEEQLADLVLFLHLVHLGQGQYHLR